VKKEFEEKQKAKREKRKAKDKEKDKDKDKDAKKNEEAEDKVDEKVKDDKVSSRSIYKMIHVCKSDVSRRSKNCQSQRTRRRLT
jgi:hypothetical protein